MWNRKTLLVVVSLLAVYVCLNLLFVSAVTIIHGVTFRVVVKNAVDHRPVAGARATIAWNDGRSLHSGRFLGLTSSSGSVSKRVVFQEQPDWAFPQLGTFQFRNMFLLVEAPGYVPEITAVANACPSVTYHRAVASMDIALKPAE